MLLPSWEAVAAAEVEAVNRTAGQKRIQQMQVNTRQELTIKTPVPQALIYLALQPCLLKPNLHRLVHITVQRAIPFALLWGISHVHNVFTPVVGPGRMDRQHQQYTCLQSGCITALFMLKLGSGN